MKNKGLKGKSGAERVGIIGCMEAKRNRGIVRYIKRCFGEVCQNHRKPAMTERFPSLGERENISFAKQTDMNLSLFTSHFSREGKRYAFTLAEVLITLGIIGVVAALTLPSVINKHRIKVLETKFKKSYGLASQIVLRAKAESGIEQLSISCGENRTYYADVCKQYFETFQTFGKADRDNLTVYNLTGDSTVDYNTNLIFTKSLYILKDGSHIKIEPEWKRLNIIVDTNGFAKPNRLGYDLFLFYLDTSNDKLVGQNTNSAVISEEDLENARSKHSADFKDSWWYERTGNPCSFKNKQRANGYGCAYYAISNTCPDDNSKTYWECLP